MLKLRCQEKQGDVKPKRQEMIRFVATDDRVVLIGQHFLTSVERPLDTL